MNVQASECFRKEKVFLDWTHYDAEKVICRDKMNVSLREDTLEGTEERLN